MKRLLILILLLFVEKISYGQLLPAFSHKFSDGLLFDPSLSGFSGGSAIFGIKKLWANVNGSPQYLYTGVHTRLKRDQLGLGLNLYLEESNILEHYCISIPIAYHMSVTKTSGISFGLSPDISRSQINRDRLQVRDLSDPVIDNLNDSYYLDFNFGVNYHNRIFQAGLSANRLVSLIQYENAGVRSVNGYLTGYVNAFLKLRDGNDRLEPSVIYRYQLNAGQQIDLGLFYFHDTGIIAGMSYRTGNIVAGHAGFNFNDRILAGYTYEMLLGSYGGTAGGSHELVCRYNFNKQYYEKADRFRTQPRTSFTIRKKQKR